MVFPSTVKDGIGTIRVTGKLMGRPPTETLHKRVKVLIERGIPWIIVDLGDLEWMNSQGIGALMTCVTSARNAGGELVVARPGRRVNSIFMVSQVVKLFTIAPSIKVAREGLIALRDVVPDA